MNLTIEVEREDDGRWIGAVLMVPGVLVCGDSRGEAISRVKALALCVSAERIDHGEALPGTS